MKTPTPAVNYHKQDLITVALLTLAVIVVYANSLGNAFISDDIGIVINVKNPAMIFIGIQFLRPLVYYLVYLVSGVVPPLFRAVDITFHIGVVILLYLLVAKMANRTVATMAAMLFAVHPLVNEAVTWIAAGVYPQYSFFFLLGLLLYKKARDDKKFPLFYAFAAYIVALLSSEKAVVFPLVLGVYELLFGSIKIRWKSLAIFFGITAVYLFVALHVMAPDRLLQLQQVSGVPARLDNPITHVATALTMYAQLFFWPQALSIYHSDPHMGTLELLIRVSALFALGAVLVVSYKKYRLLCFWLIFSILALSLTLSPYRITWIIAERYAYLATAGVATSVALLLYPLTKRQSLRTLTWTLVILATILLGYRTFLRNRDWKSDDTFWLATTLASPTEPKAHNSLASIYAKQKDYPRAIKELESAIALRPSYAPAYYNLGLVYESLGQTPKAIDYYRQTLVHNPLEPHAKAALKRLGVTQ